MKKYTFDFDHTDELRAVANAIDAFDKETMEMFKEAMSGSATVREVGKGKLEVVFKTMAPLFGDWTDVDAHKKTKNLADSIMKGAFHRRLDLLKTLDITVNHKESCGN